MDVRHQFEIYGCLTVTSKWKWMSDIQNWWFHGAGHPISTSENGCLTSNINVWKWMSDIQYRCLTSQQYQHFRKWMSDIQFEIYGCLTVLSKWKWMSDIQNWRFRGVGYPKCLWTTKFALWHPNCGSNLDVRHFQICMSHTWTFS